MGTVLSLLRYSRVHRFQGGPMAMDALQLTSMSAVLLASEPV